MKKSLTHLITVLSLFSAHAIAQPGEWTWMHGDSIPGAAGNFGTQGVPSPTNEPPGFYEACEWTDLNGKLWLFGGIGSGGEWADLWKYDPLTEEWTWMKGNGIPNDPGNYGVLGVSSPSNLPAGRGWGVTTWTDLTGDLWLFGGYQAGVYNDLWKYSIATNEWTWIKGPQGPGQPGVAGILGVPDPANTPEPRAECNSAWTDNNNNLWLFGGYPGYRNDMWRYNISTDEWTWMKGSQTIGQNAVYGTFGVEDPANIPGARESYSHWTDAIGNLYLFAGRSTTATFNDFWRYNPVTNNWAWIGGTNLSFPPGQFNTQCVWDSTNMPAERCENRAVCKDQFGNFWLFGGGAQSTISTNRNDLWMFCVSRNQWIWVSGDSIISPTPLFGTRGVSSPQNKPPGKAGANMWCDQNGHIYVFGGSLASGNGNDLWKFNIDYNCASCNTIPTALFSAPNHICPGTCTDFVNLSNYATSFLWSFPGAVPSVSTDANPQGICYNIPGTYPVTLIATNITGSDTLTLNNYITVYPQPAPQGIMQSGDTLFANLGATSYQWFYNGNIIPGATEYFYVATQSGDYNVVATDENDCEVEAVINDVIASIQYTVDSRQVTAFPNPVTETLDIRGLENNSADEIKIFNVFGEIVFTDVHCKLPIANCKFLSAGMYYLEIKSSEKIYRTKFLKQ